MKSIEGEPEISSTPKIPDISKDAGNLAKGVAIK
jgi:hypothetical protein